MATDSAARSVVLVHGGFVDGSGWRGVYDRLKQDGYGVAVVQNPTVSHADDVAVTKRVLDAQSEPVILVGHSYGGAVITEAGNHPKVAALVYIAGFVPDKGESVNTLIGGFPTDGRRFCRPRTAFCSSTEPSLLRRLQRTSTPNWPSSWPTRKSRGALRPRAARSANLRGRASQAGTSSRPKTE